LKYWTTVFDAPMREFFLQQAKQGGDVEAARAALGERDPKTGKMPEEKAHMAVTLYLNWVHEELSKVMSAEAQSAQSRGEGLRSVAR
jgi:hypothetical protein